MNGMGRAKKKDKKCSGSLQAQFFTAFYHAQLGVSFPDSSGSLPNADLPCCLNLLPKKQIGRLFQSQMGFDDFLGDIHYFPSG